MKHRRIFGTDDFHVREAEEDGDIGSMEGHAAVFNREGDGFFFTEEIAPGAFRSSLEEKRKIFALWNHNSSFPLASTEAGLELKEDDIGLFTRISPSDTSFARDLMQNVRAGHVNKMSFGFMIRDEELVERDDKPHFIVKDVELFEVSPVTFPFYEDTDLSVTRDQQNDEAVILNYTERTVLQGRDDISIPVSVMKRLSKHGVSNESASNQLRWLFEQRKREIELRRLFSN